MTSFQQIRRVALAVVALGAIGMSGTAFAQNTASGTTITNTATVNYSVNSIPQTAINASTNFVVDTVVNVNVTGGTSVNVTPGQLAAVSIYTVTNTSNISSNFNLTPTNQAGDNFDVANIAVRVDGNGNGTYEAANDTATSITGLARNASVAVFILGDIPGSATNTQTGIARLTANAINPATSAAWVNDTSADVAGTVQIVVQNNSAFAQDTYVVATATLGVTKSSSVISDPVNGSVSGGNNPKAIPGAVMEYAITIANTGSQPATLQSINDPIPTNTTFYPAQYTGGTDVSIQVGAAAATFCMAEPGGTDNNSDGCVLTVGGALSVGAPAITTVAAGSTVTVRFQVTIN
jgi:uncharacterized repeat protein (TIGR01451 family)